MQQSAKLVILLKILLALTLSAGLFFSNLPRFMSEFNQLDIFWSTPIWLQALTFLSSILYLCFFRKINAIFVTLLLLVSASSWYTITVSNATNNIVTRLGGIPIHNIEFQDIQEISFNRFTATINGKNEHHLFVGLYPVGLNYKNIKNYFIETNHCIAYEKEKCVRVEFD